MDVGMPRLNGYEATRRIRGSRGAASNHHRADRLGPRGTTAPSRSKPGATAIWSSQWS